MMIISYVKKKSWEFKNLKGDLVLSKSVNDNVVHSDLLERKYFLECLLSISPLTDKRKFRYIAVDGVQRIDKKIKNSKNRSNYIFVDIKNIFSNPKALIVYHNGKWGIMNSKLEIRYYENFNFIYKHIQIWDKQYLYIKDTNNDDYISDLYGNKLTWSKNIFSHIDENYINNSYYHEFVAGVSFFNSKRGVFCLYYSHKEKKFILCMDNGEIIYKTKKYIKVVGFMGSYFSLKTSADKKFFKSDYNLVNLKNKKIIRGEIVSPFIKGSRVLLKKNNEYSLYDNNFNLLKKFKNTLLISNDTDKLAGVSNKNLLINLYYGLVFMKNNSEVWLYEFGEFSELKKQSIKNIRNISSFNDGVIWQTTSNEYQYYSFQKGIINLPFLKGYTLFKKVYNESLLFTDKTKSVISLTSTNGEIYFRKGTKVIVYNKQFKKKMSLSSSKYFILEKDKNHYYLGSFIYNLLGEKIFYKKNIFFYPIR